LTFRASQPLRLIPENKVNIIDTRPNSFFLGQGAKPNFESTMAQFQKEYAKMIIKDQTVEECSWRFRFRKEETIRASINNINFVLWNQA